MTQNELCEALATVCRASTDEPLASAIVHAYQQVSYDTTKDVLVIDWGTEGANLDIAIGNQKRSEITLHPRALLFASTVDTLAGQRAPGLMADAIRKLLTSTDNRQISAGGDTADRNGSITWVGGTDEVDGKEVRALEFTVTYRIPNDT
jgi:hypothetical protein